MIFNIKYFNIELILAYKLLNIMIYILLTFFGIFHKNKGIIMTINYKTR